MITKTGEKVMSAMKRTYGSKKGEFVFYASKNANKPGSQKWERRAKGGDLT